MHVHFIIIIHFPSCFPIFKQLFIYGAMYFMHSILEIY